MSNLRAGHARRPINPPLGTRMAGYASRTEGCKSIHDPIHVNAVALDDGATRCVVLQFDLCSFRRNAGKFLIHAVSQATGLPVESILTSVSHTHAGPMTTGVAPGDEQTDYGRHIVDQAVQAAREAIGDLAEVCEFAAGEAPADVGANRREKISDGRIILGVNREGPRLAVLTAWRFAREGRPDIALWSIPIHGTTVGPENLEISAEWMGNAVARFERAHPDAQAVFLQGCGGDQNPYRDPRSFEQMDTLGARAAASLDEALDGAKPVAATPLRTTFSLAPCPSADGTTDPVPVPGLRIGDAVAVGLGGEAVVEYALHGRRASKAASTMILGYADWTVNYLVTAAMLDEGGYEPTAFQYFPSGKPWAPDIERVLKESIDATLAALE